MDDSKSNEGNEITLYIIGKDNEIFKNYLEKLMKQKEKRKNIN